MASAAKITPTQIARSVKRNDLRHCLRSELSSTADESMPFRGLRWRAEPPALLARAC
jgi:hypothetical protein